MGKVGIACVGGVALLLTVGCSASSTPAGGGPIADAGPVVPDATLLCADDVCQCEIDDDCGDHGICELDGEVGTCGCVTGYQVIDGVCVWQGLANQGFDEDPQVWEIVGADLAIVRDDPGGVDPGVAVLNQAALDAFDSIVQTHDMPPLFHAQAMVVDVGYRTTAVFNGSTLANHTGPGPAINVSGFWHRIRRPRPNPELWRRARVCLGEGAYGGPVDFRMSTAHPRQQLYAVHTMEVDQFVVTPAVPGECPQPGEILNGDFEGTDGWLVEGQGDVGIEDAVGDDGSRGGALQAACNAYSKLSGAVSVPLATGGSGYALRFSWTGTDGDVLEVGLDNSEIAEFTARSGEDHLIIGSLRGAGGLRQQGERLCLPSWSHGSVMPLEFALTKLTRLCQNDGRRFTIDNLELIEDADCPVGGPVDPGFERAGDGIQSGWATSRWLGNESKVVYDPPSADNNNQGSHRALFTYDPIDANCSFSKVESALEIPEVGPGQRAALRFSYFMPAGSNEYNGFWINARNLVYPYHNLILNQSAQSGVWTSTANICFHPTTGGRTQNVAIEFWTWVDSLAQCTPILEVQTAMIDDVEVVVVPEAECGASD